MADTKTRKRRLASYIGARIVDPKPVPEPVDTAPVNAVLPAITGTPQVGASLTVSNGTWTGAPAPTYTWQWKADAANINGATAASYVLTEAELGKVITCVVTGTNSAGNANATSAATAAVIAAA
ncbi:MAG TPA: hypothetical protein VG519_13355 [Pseudochrobactrum sp.]|nr:hypothetical protein [Pseudochrobactrum sp.]